MKMELAISPEILEAVAREVATMLSPVLETRGVCPKCRGAQERKVMPHGRRWIEMRQADISKFQGPRRDTAGELTRI